MSPPAGATLTLTANGNVKDFTWTVRQSSLPLCARIFYKPISFHSFHYMNPAHILWEFIRFSDNQQENTNHDLSAVNASACQ